MELLEPLLRELFERHWAAVVFGYCIQGAVFELQPAQRPRVSLLDGYLTIDHGYGHLHLCIGEHRGSAANPTPADVAAWRRVGRAAWYRALNREHAPVSWGLRMWNGRGEQMLTVFFPNPYYDSSMRRQPPDWDKLALWNRHARALSRPAAAGAGPGDDARSARLTPGAPTAARKALRADACDRYSSPAFGSSAFFGAGFAGAGFFAAALSSSSLSMSATRLFIWSYL